MRTPALCVPLAIVSAFIPTALLSQTQNTNQIPNSDSSYIDADGTAHITRVIPIPNTVSAEARKVLARRISDAKPAETLKQRREHTDTWQTAAGKRFQELYPVDVEEQTMAGVKVRAITPHDIPEEKRDHLLINLHGGGFNSDSGSLTESIPVAYLSKTKVIAVLYRLAPEHAFPAAVDDVVAVYKEVLKTYKAEHVAIFGTSAGAVLTGEVASRLRQLSIPLPAALGIFSGFGDFARIGDSRSMYALNGLAGYLAPPSTSERPDTSYTGNTDLKDPVLSPIYTDLHNFPPTLFITSTRDLLLSGTCNMQRAFLRAGVETQLVVFDALAHAFWNDPNLPESREAHETMARFLDTHLH